MEMDSFSLHFFFLVFFLPIQSLAQANRTIPVNTSLTATQNSTPWISPSGDFAFGFQFIEQSALFLLSIWYNKLPEKTIVWYPIGDNSVPNGSKLELNAQLGLVLTDPQGNPRWSSPLKYETTRIDHGYINDTGNFVLMGPDSLSLWESFENPSDTLLPTQTMEINGVLNSRRSDTNFSQGRFQFRLLENGNAVLNPRNEHSNLTYDSYYSSDTNDNLNSTKSGHQVVLEETGHLFIIRRNGERLDLMSQLVTSSREYYYRAMLDFDGVFVIYSLPKDQDMGQNWTSIWSKPDNSICSLDGNGRPDCECPKGYSLVDRNDKYGSCKSSFVQSCDEKEASAGEDLYYLEELSYTDWPFNDYEQMTSFSEEVCRNSCLNDCFCAVAIQRDSNCWKKRLPLSNGRRFSSFSGKAFLKIKKDDLPNKDPDSSGKIPDPSRKKGTLISMLLGSSVFMNFILLGVGLFGFFHIYKRKIAKPILGNNVVETNLRTFSYEELVEATNGFTEELGRGAFGIVYKGIIDMGGIRGNVAIKKLDRVVHDGDKNFKAEINGIGHTHHKNLVRLLGYCNHGENRLLVYEYMSNGTLASFLFGASKPSWNLRTQIALGIARGLLYLHEECTTQIIHCDIKPRNILLDDYYNGRISDFGVAKLLMIDQSHTNTAIRGTKGYVAPEWFRNNPITTKVDVYSFGVLLLEIVTCRKSVERFSVGGEERDILVDWVWDCFQQGKLEALVENDIEALNDMKVLERFVLVGIWCIQEDPYVRPNMRKVSQMLEGVVEVTLPPCPWPFSSVTMGPE